MSSRVTRCCYAIVLASYSGADDFRVVLVFNPVRSQITDRDACANRRTETTRHHRLGTYVLGTFCSGNRPMGYYEVRAFRSLRDLDDPLLQRMLDSMTRGLLPPIDPGSRDSPCNVVRC